MNYLYLKQQLKIQNNLALNNIDFPIGTNEVVVTN